MRRWLTAALSVPFALTALIATLPAQSLGSRVAAAPDGAVAFRFAARPGICGDGRTFIMLGHDTRRGYTIYAHDGTYISGRYVGGLPGRCLLGPVQIVLDIRGGEVRHLRVSAGPPATDGIDTDLGTVSAAEAGAFLLRWAERARDESFRQAMLAANLADSAAIADQLGAMASDRNLRPEVREHALRWLAGAADREENSAVLDIPLRIATDSLDYAAVRERAIRVFGETADGDVVVRRLYATLAERSLRERAIRVVGSFGGDRNAEWLGSIALDRNEALALRERAIRMLGDDAYVPDRLRTMYAQLDEPSLKERVIRVLGAFGGEATAEWLRTIALDRTERLAHRERAIRVLGSDVYVSDALLRDLYPQLTEPSLRDRIIRVVGSAGGGRGVPWLRTIAEDRTEHRQLRDRALRALGDQGRTHDLRALYPRLEDMSLRERVIRIVDEHGAADDVAWIRAIAQNARESEGLRDRALRTLASRGEASAELATLYDGLGSYNLRDRILRLLGDRGDDDAVNKLIAVAERETDPSLRRRALRELADSGHPRALAFLERMVQRNN